MQRNLDAGRPEADEEADQNEFPTLKTIIIGGIESEMKDKDSQLVWKRNGAKLRSV